MSASSVIAADRLKPGDALWLVVALLLHASLLLMPAQRNSITGPTAAGLQLNLIARPDAAEMPPGADAPVQPPSAVDDPVIVIPREAPGDMPKAGQPSRAKIPPAMTTPGLIDALGRARLEPTEPHPTRRLGDKPVYRPPKNWRPLNAFGVDVAGDPVSTGQPGVIDRWQAADGSRHVLIRTAGGDVYCGRTLPWDAMNPLFEPVRMYRKCGREGRRSFGQGLR